MTSFEYFVLRCVPRVDRQEFLNVGVVLYGQDSRFLRAACDVDPERLKALGPDVDPEDINAHLETIAAICRGDEAGGPAALLSERQRFDWLAAPRSTVVQPGPVHSGLTSDPAAELEHLLDRLVH
ncbi:MAG TPA: DUF3037 domain-containing protein [Actinomycetota bacterium]|jgi:hypothetical protein|nr:DUF3037 domain-containing protein [Actinomycetota bacterium]